MNKIKLQPYLARAAKLWRTAVSNPLIIPFNAVFLRERWGVGCASTRISISAPEYSPRLADPCYLGFLRQCDMLGFFTQRGKLSRLSYNYIHITFIISEMSFIISEIILTVY